MKEMEIGLAMSPGNMHQAVFMDFPVSMGGYEYTKTPDNPCVIQMISCPYGETVGAPRLEQYREARYRMLGLQFKEYEEEIRSHLSGMLPKKLFDFDRDVESITVNRWGHGYTVGGPEGSVKKKDDNRLAELPLPIATPPLVLMQKLQSIWHQGP